MNISNGNNQNHLQKHGQFQIKNYNTNRNAIDVKDYIKQNKDKIYLIDGHHPYDAANSSFYVYSNDGDDLQDNTKKSGLQGLGRQQSRVL